METLGSLCDKLTIVKLKQYHTAEKIKLDSLNKQEIQLKCEIDEYIFSAIKGTIPEEKLIFESNKVYKKQGNEVSKFQGNIGEAFAELAKVNCDLWHEQENVYEFEKVQEENKNHIVKQLALLNLQRNQCIDVINENFRKLIKNKIS